jgi:hypothetical protein
MQLYNNQTAFNPSCLFYSLEEFIGYGSAWAKLRLLFINYNRDKGFVVLSSFFLLILSKLDVFLN